jgi:SHS2 domain-containing protein
MERRHEFLDHTADTGIRVSAPDAGALFEECALAMFAVMYQSPPDTTPPPANIEVAAAGDTIEELLVAWLSELLFVAEARHMVLSTFVVDELEVGLVRGLAGGRPAAEVELDGPPIKAVTYHQLEVAHNGGWWATVIFDV